MERGCKKTTENIYLRCRKEAAKYNEALSSRERASEQLGISDASLRNYELGITKLIPADIILIMAELYNAPELPSHYCLNECPLGQCHAISEEVHDLDRVTVKLLRNLKVDNIRDIKDRLLDIAEDGVISEEEKPDLKEVLEYLDDLAKTVSELKIIGQRALNRRD